MNVGISLAMSYRVYNCINVLINFMWCTSREWLDCLVVCLVTGMTVHFFQQPCRLTYLLVSYRSVSLSVCQYVCLYSCLIVYFCTFLYTDYQKWWIKMNIIWFRETGYQVYLRRRLDEIDPCREAPCGRCSQASPSSSADGWTGRCGDCTAGECWEHDGDRWPTTARCWTVKEGSLTPT